MSDKPDGSDLVENKNFQKQLEIMDDDADDAEKQWKSQVGNAEFKSFPSDFLAQYKSDGNDLIKSRRVFNAEWNKVVVGRGDPKKLLSAYDEYSESLELMRESNARFKAMIDIKIASQAAAWLTVFMALAKLGIALKLAKELKELQVELQKAEHEVSDAKLKRVLNVALSAVTLVLVPEATIARVAVVAGGISGHILIDYALGQGSAKATAVTVAGDGADAIEKLGEVGKKFMGAAAAVIIFKFDSDEVAEAKEIVDEVRPKLEHALKEFKEFMADAGALVPRLRALDTGIKKCVEEIKKAMTRSADATKNYDAIKNAIKKSLKP